MAAFGTFCTSNADRGSILGRLSKWGEKQSPRHLVSDRDMSYAQSSCVVLVSLRELVCPLDGHGAGALGAYEYYARR